MNKTELRLHAEESLKSCVSTLAVAQSEYAYIDTESAFQNFDRIADEVDTSRQKVWYTFFRKHIDGIAAHIKGHTSQREDIRGRIKDAIVYLLILWAMLDDLDGTAPRA